MKDQSKDYLKTVFEMAIHVNLEERRETLKAYHPPILKQLKVRIHRKISMAKMWGSDLRQKRMHGKRTNNSGTGFRTQQMRVRRNEVALTRGEISESTFMVCIRWKTMRRDKLELEKTTRDSLFIQCSLDSYIWKLPRTMGGRCCLRPVWCVTWHKCDIRKTFSFRVCYFPSRTCFLEIIYMTILAYRKAVISGCKGFCLYSKEVSRVEKY